MKFFLISLILFSLLVINSQAKDDKKPKKTWTSVTGCQARVLANPKYVKNSTDIISENCLQSQSKVQKSSSCQNYGKKMAKNASKLTDPVPSGALSDWRSCYKKCKDTKAVKDDGEAKQIAQALIDCSSSTLALSLFIMGVIASLIL